MRRLRRAAPQILSMCRSARVTAYNGHISLVPAEIAAMRGTTTAALHAARGTPRIGNFLDPAAQSVPCTAPALREARSFRRSAPPNAVYCLAKTLRPVQMRKMKITLHLRTVSIFATELQGALPRCTAPTVREAVRSDDVHRQWLAIALSRTLRQGKRKRFRALLICGVCRSPQPCRSSQPSYTLPENQVMRSSTSQSEAIGEEKRPAQLSHPDAKDEVHSSSAHHVDLRNRAAPCLKIRR